MKIAVIGTGYVGLVAGACFASKAHDVICVDVIKEKVDKINRGISPIFEEGLEDMLHDLVPRKKLRATLNLKKAVLESELIFISVGTPSKDEAKFDYTYLEQATKDVGLALKEADDYKVVVIKSTCIPGTTINLLKPILEQMSGKKCGKDFGLGFSPEFLREGVAVYDFMNPDRIVIGGVDDKSIEMIESVFINFNSPIMNTDPTTAEMIKITSNSFLAMKISFINEMANIAEKIGSDIKDIAKGIGMDSRISPKFLGAGLGWGGSCFPKDVSALCQQTKEVGVPSLMLESTIAVNKKQPLRSIELLEEALEDNTVKGKKIAVLGLAFKPNTDDMREAVSIPIINSLLDKGAKVHAHDPAAMKNAKEIFDSPNLFLEEDPIQALSDAEGCILVTEWRIYGQLSPKTFKGAMKTPILIDGRRLFDSKKMRTRGIKYFGIGLGK